MTQLTVPASAPGPSGTHFEELGRELWRPDREPRDDSEDHRWVVVDPSGRLRLADGTDIAVHALRPGDGGVMTFALELRPRVERLRRSPLPAIVATRNRRVTVAG